MPGLRLKRWVLVSCLGVVLLVLGAIGLGLGIFNPPSPDSSAININFYTLGAIFIGLGVVLVFTGVYRLLRTIEKLLRKGEQRGIAQLAWDQRKRESGRKAVCLGGGHGLSNLLTGLKQHPLEITAVVSMADDGGSSGRLRKDFDLLPPGDIRNCLVALADAGPVMQELMQYRFTEGEFAGHSFGNLFIMVLSIIREDFGQAIRESNRILSVQGMVLPATLDRVSLVATHPDGTKTTGQRHIATCGKRIEQLELKPEAGRAPHDVIQAILDADIIVIGPGSLYTSVLPPLLEEDIVNAICQSRAAKLLVVNTMSQKGETDSFGVHDYLDAFERHVPRIVPDAVLVNSFRPGNKKLEEYAQKGVCITEYDRASIKQKGWRIFLRDVIDLDDPSRHAAAKLSQAVMDILAELRG